jgi:uncharacterized protein YnzC (UPF0291/DUF896 family)
LSAKGARKVFNESIQETVTKTAKGKKPVTCKPEPLKRPSWRQSEIDVAKRNQGYSEQKSFKGGKEVRYGTKGSTRPDLYKDGHSIEVKNYKIDNSLGKSRLKSELVRQYKDRVKNLPPNTKQTTIIDTRGQNISPKDLKELKNSIQEEAKNLEIIFMSN